jgi:translocation and assembly module TamB
MDRLELARLPGAAVGNGAPLRLPVPVRLRRLVIAQVVSPALGPSLPPLTVTGNGFLAGADSETDLLLAGPGRGDRWRLTLAPGPQGHRLSVAVTESADGPLATLADSAGVPRPPGFADWTLSAQVQGPLIAAAVDVELASGPYRALANGVIDLPARRISALDVRLDVAAMKVHPAGLPAPLSWEAIVAHAELAGPLRSPRGTVRASADGVALHRVGAPRPDAGRASGRGSGAPGESAVLLAGALQLDGRFDLAARPRVWATLTAAPTRVPEPFGMLLGDEARLVLTAERHGSVWALDNGRLEARLLELELAGRLGGDLLDLSWALGLRAPNLLGSAAGVRLDARGQATGTPMSPRLDADLALRRTTAAARAPDPSPTSTAPRANAAGGEVQGRLRLEPMAPVGRLVLAGSWRGEPVAVELAVDPLPGGGLELSVDDSRWAGIRVAGRLRLTAAARLPTGDLRFGISSLDAVVSVLGARPPLDLLDLGAAARLRLTPQSAAAPGAVRLALAGRLDPRLRRLELDSLRVDAQRRRVTLLAPVAVDFGTGITLDSFRLGLSEEAGAGTGPGADAGGVLELTGQIAPRLALDARLADLDLAAVSPWLPSPWSGIRGLLDAEARLSGSAGAPTGRLTLDGRGLAVAGSRGLGLPPATARLTLTLAEIAARLAAEAQLGERARLALDGSIGRPLRRASAPLDLRAAGHLDLSLLDGWLGAGGRRAEGRVGLDLLVVGTRAAPRLDGRLEVADAAWRDRRLGLWLDDIAGRVRVSEERLRIERLAARSGAGTLSLDGGVDQWASERSLDLRLRARGAEPIRLDLLRLRGDADLSLTGRLSGDLSLTGEVRFDEVDIRIPEQLPADVPTLEVVELGERRQPRPARRATTASGWPARLDLDVGIDAARAVQVRGRNIDAELGGSVRLRGPANAPVAEGGFALLRGEYALIGQRLAFTRGRIGLDGADLLDPTLDLEARAQGAGAVAILAVAGRARAPTLVLRGEPPMSDDEVLSRLLFGVPPNRLSALQLTRLGLAATSIAGVGGDGVGMLARARAGLGLSRLRIDGDKRGGTALEAGRRLSERLYLGGRQVLEGGDPRAVLGIQVAPQIRFESDVGSRGSGAGAAFELEY